MGFLDKLDAPSPRKDRRLCPHCECTAAACRAVDWLNGKSCCDRCLRDHDATAENQPDGLRDPKPMFTQEIAPDA